MIEENSVDTMLADLFDAQVCRRHVEIVDGAVNNDEAHVGARRLHVAQIHVARRVANYEKRRTICDAERIVDCR